SGSNGAAGVRGLQEGTTSSTYGVQGVTFSAQYQAAGVYGSAGGGSGHVINQNFGVFGESSYGAGVVGVSLSEGVAGYHVTSTGGSTSGTLGFSDKVGVFFFNVMAGTGTKSFVETHPTEA